MNTPQRTPRKKSQKYTSDAKGDLMIGDVDDTYSLERYLSL